MSTPNFNHYYTNAELDTLLAEWVDAYPTLLERREIGRSFEGRPIWLLVLTNRDTGADTAKPAVWVDANIHATEVAGTTTVLHIVHTLLSGYGHDERITRLLDTSTLYAVPRINPDGAELALADQPRYLRSGVRPYPWDELAAGIHQQDVDGDGRILQMRIQDPNGDWVVSELDPRLMRKRRPDEYGGTYYRLLPEGMLEDFDGYIIEVARPREGLDFNRNFPYDWRPENEQRGAGPYPTSEPEIRAIVDFIANHPNINAALTYHTYSGVILRPYSTKPDEQMNTDDLWVFQKIGQRGSELTGYPCVSVYHDFRYHPKEVITGAFDDWLYDHFGMFAFTVELWDIVGRAGITNRKFIDWFRDHPHEDDLKILRWADEHIGPDAFVEWYEFDHPQLGKVELGGWNFMYTWRNPPHHLMGEEAARNTPFVLALAEMLPRLHIHTLAITPLDDDVWHINLVVENSGYLPTYTSQQAKERQAVRPVRAELRLPDGAVLVSGKRRVELGHLEGRSNKHNVIFAYSPTDNRARTEWVVRAPRGTSLTLTIASERAGELTRTIHLEPEGESA
nr:M14 family metallopeptidase [Ardenticatena sp.]